MQEVELCAAIAAVAFAEPDMEFKFVRRRAKRAI